MSHPVPRVLVGLFYIIVCQGIFQGLHLAGIYPDRWFAEMLLQTPTLSQTSLVYWFLSAVVVAVLWIVTDYFLYKRPSSKSDKILGSAVDKLKQTLAEGELIKRQQMLAKEQRVAAAASRTVSRSSLVRGSELTNSTIRGNITNTDVLLDVDSLYGCDVSGNMQFGASPSPPPSSARNAWLSDAIHYAHLRAWPPNEPGLVDYEFGGLLNEFMQAAIDGQLTVWGKNMDETALYQKLKPSYWHDYSLDEFGFMHGREMTCSESRSHRLPEPGLMRALMTSREQVESLWPPTA